MTGKKKKRSTKTAKIEKEAQREDKKKTTMGQYISRQLGTVCRMMVLLTPFSLKMFAFFNIAHSHHICFPPYRFCAERTHSLAVKASVLSQLVREGPCQAFHTISN